MLTSRHRTGNDRHKLEESRDSEDIHSLARCIILVRGPKNVSEDAECTTVSSVQRTMAPPLLLHATSHILGNSTANKADAKEDFLVQFVWGIVRKSRI